MRAYAVVLGIVLAVLGAGLAEAELQNVQVGGPITITSPYYTPSIPYLLPGWMDPNVKDALAGWRRKQAKLQNVQVGNGIGIKSVPFRNWKFSASRVRFRAPEWTIVVAEDAIPSERYAAEELQAILKEATGVEIPIKATPPKADHNIFVGPGKDMAASSAGFSVDGLRDEGLQIRIAPENIAIAGGRPRGTLYGVYEFLERHFGVRFLTHDHTHVPACGNTKVLGEEGYSFKPTFSFRWSYYGENTRHKSFAARMRSNAITDKERLGGTTPQSLINHTFYRYINVDTHGKDHPEYFAEIDGERKLDIGGGGPEPCVSNPEVIRIITEGILADLRANPARKNISCSQNDNDAYGRCERCEAINEREGTPMGANLLLVNTVADAVAQEFPDVKVGTLSYWYTRKPPKHMKPRDNVQVQLCSIECCTTRALNDPASASNREFCEDMEGWSAICDDIWVWHYNTNFAAYLLPFPNLRAIGPNMRFFAENNVKGVFMQANGNGHAGELSDLRNYVMSRCLWDPSRDSWKEAMDFCRLHYGESSQPIMEYLDYIHDVALAHGAEPGCFGTAEEFGITAEVARETFGFFEAALSLSQDPVIRARVEKASLCAYSAMIETATEFRYADGTVRLAVPDGYTGLIERFATLCGRYEMTRATEHMAIGPYLEKARKYRDGIPAARLENDTWRMTLLPADKGKMMELLHKPTGRNLLRAWPRAGLRECGGTSEEAGERGLDLSPGTYEVQAEGDALVMKKSLPDGSTVARTASLVENRVRFETTLTHGGAEPKVYQVKVRPEWDMVATDKDAGHIAGYIRDGETWKDFSRDWKLDHGPDDGLLASASGGGFAFYNSDAGFGVAQTYDPAQFEKPRMWCNYGRHQLNLELFTRRVELKQGESTQYAYECELRDKPLLSFGKKKVSKENQ
jgi:uncharacterized protein DUF4838/glycosyl hydrolase family 67